MPGAYIVECVRTAGGKKNGRLSKWHPISLGAAVLDAVVERSGIDGKHIDDVIVGCVSQGGGQADGCYASAEGAGAMAEVAAGPER